MATKRIRGRRHQEIRRIHLERFPLCAECDRNGRVRLGADVDHIVPLFKGGPESAANRQTLCSACHAVKTARDLGQRSKRKIGMDGFPVEEDKDDKPDD